MTSADKLKQGSMKLKIFKNQLKTLNYNYLTLQVILSNKLIEMKINHLINQIICQSLQLNKAMIASKTK